MSQVIFKNLPTTFIDKEIDFSEINQLDKELLVEIYEYMHDYIYVESRKTQKDIEYLGKKDFNALISKYK